MAGEVIEFDIQTPLTERIVRRHIANAMSLGLREAIPEAEALTVLANGPSARKAPQTGTVLALNGALRICPNPTFYAACDPQEGMVDFLRSAPARTQYYIASKCHPAVFKALRHRDVRLWHVADYVPDGVPTACSITLTALSLFIRLGWRKFDVYGWDGCYVNGEHHASDQPHNGGPNDIDLVVGDRTFKTTRTWAAEAQDAVYLLPLFEFLGAEITIHGDSMIKAIRDHRSIAA